MTEEKKVKINVTVSLTEETLEVLFNYRKTRGFPSFDEAISTIISDSLGSSSTPMWTDTEIISMPDAERQIIKTIFVNGSMSFNEIANKTGINDDSLRGHMAQITRRYRSLKKEPLIKFNETTGKYEPESRYREMILRLLG
jgi:hypothetical protein